MPKKVHPADLATFEAVKRAVHFTATIRKDMGNITFELPTLALARAAARIMPRAFAVNRGAIVYAVTPEDWTFMVPSNMADPNNMETMPMGNLLSELASKLGGDPKSDVMRSAIKDISAEADRSKSGPDLEIPAALKISAEDRAAAWKAKPPVAPAAKPVAKKEKPAKDAKPATTQKPAAGAAEKQEKDMSRKSAKTTGSKARIAVKAKATTAKKPASGERNRYDWNGAEEAANKGILPKAPNFSAPTHERFRPLLAEVKKAAEAKDVAGLRKIKIEPLSSSPKAVKRYRDLCVKALIAKPAAKSA